MPILDRRLYPVDRLRRGKRESRGGKKKGKKGVMHYLPSGSVASKVGKGACEPAVDFIKC